VTNPKLIVEVLSTGTADYDRGEKLRHYQRLASLACVVLIDHQSERIETWTRGEADLEHASFAGGDVVPLDAISCTLAVTEVLAAAREA
jgi:Uma2 family endonuclease